jgi:hypothetical protein
LSLACLLLRHFAVLSRQIDPQLSLLKGRGVTALKECRLGAPSAIALSQGGLELQRHMVQGESSSVDKLELNKCINSTSYALSDRSRWLVVTTLEAPIR